MSSLFPHFRQRFLHESVWAKETVSQELTAVIGGSQQPLVKMAGRGTALQGPGGFAKPLMLDLDSLQPARDDPLLDADTMLQQKRDKLAAFDKQCSKVAEGLYVSGKTVAENYQILSENKITHVVNCVGALYPEFFKSNGIMYKTLWLQDIPQEDIMCILYDTFDFIEAARKGHSIPTVCSSTGNPFALQQPPCSFKQQQSSPPQQQPQQQDSQQQQSEAAALRAPEGRVLVHCSQGVSRSTTIAIAYIMWKTGGSYEEVYQTVRALRGVTSPNIGFMCQLMNWAKRRQRPPSRVRVYRIAPHCPDDPTYLIPKAVSPRPGCAFPDWSTLDTRGCFVIHLPTKVYVWKGATCLSDMAEAGFRAARGLMTYEDAPAAELVRQGEEPDDLVAALDPSDCCNNSQPSTAVSMEPSSSNLAGTGPAAALAVCSPAVRRPVVAGSPSAGDEDMQTSPAPGSRPSLPPSQHQQRPPAPWASPQPSRPGSATSTTPQPQQQQQQQNSLSPAPSDPTQLSIRLSSQQLGGSFGGVGVTEVPEYNADYELWLRAALKSGGASCSEAGRLTPRASLANLVVDDLTASASGRSDSPATIEGRNRKYRRSESEGLPNLRVVPSFRQPGRLSTSSNSNLWPAGSPSAAAAAAAGGNKLSSTALHASAPSAQAAAGHLAVPSSLKPDRRTNSEPASTAAAAAAAELEDVSSVGTEQQQQRQQSGGIEAAAEGQINRMSIDGRD